LTNGIIPFIKFVFFALFFIVGTAGAFSFGRKEAVNNPQNQPSINVKTTADQPDAGENISVKITGRIQIYGNEPHTFVGIIDHQDGTEYAVFPPSPNEELRGLQGRLIEFTVVKQDGPMGFGALQLKGGSVKVIEWRIIH